MATPGLHDPIEIGGADLAHHTIPCSYRIVPDVYPDSGSLGGIYSGLAAAGQLVIRYCCGYAVPEPGAGTPYALPTARVGRAGTGHRGATGAAARAVRTSHVCRLCASGLRHAGSRSPGFFDAVRVCYLDEATVRDFDPKLRSFFNINTPADLAAGTGTCSGRRSLQSGKGWRLDAACLPVA